MSRRHAQICVAIAAAATLGVVIAANARSATPPETTAPTVNEVPFDHPIHAGQYGIPCLDCHVYADKSPVAGLPSGRKCMGCHKFVAKDNPVVQKLAERVAAGQPLEWLRVFAVPDFIYFSHRMHVRAKVSCAECHGDMTARKTITQDEPFTMGRCMACHDERHATRDCLSCHK
jgi:hypothetical protein